MSGTLAVLDFLNSREKALVVWLVAIVASAALNSDGLASSFLGVLRALCSWKLLLLFGSAALYSAALVFLGRNWALWYTTATKATVYRRSGAHARAGAVPLPGRLGFEA